MKKVFDYPGYYEAAFSNRRLLKETRVLSRSIELFSGIPVKTVLEIGCGPAAHMVALTRAGYHYVGIDINRKMIQAAKEKARKTDCNAALLTRNMIDFTLEKKVDFAFILLGSLYCRNTDELISHFNSVGNALKAGGLYFLDWCVQFDRTMEHSESWEINKGDVRIHASYERKFVDLVEQVFLERIKLGVKNSGGSFKLEERMVRRAIYPQEFLLLIKQLDRFEFIGWWNNWHLEEPLGKALSGRKGSEIKRPIIVIRKKT